MKKFKRIAIGLFWLAFGVWLVHSGMAQENIIIGALEWLLGFLIAAILGVNKIFPNSLDV